MDFIVLYTTTTAGVNVPEIKNNYIFRSKDFQWDEWSPRESILSPVGTSPMICTNQRNIFKIIYRKVVTLFQQRSTLCSLGTLSLYCMLIRSNLSLRCEERYCFPASRNLSLHVSCTFGTTDTCHLAVTLPAGLVKIQ
jgi:hypothetical protein